MKAEKKMTISQKLKYCVGCRDNYYNRPETSNSSDGLCWGIHFAKLVSRKEVHINQKPPWKQKAIKVLHCYHRPRYVYVEPNQEY
jgi:hypothetical protein